MAENAINLITQLLKKGEKRLTPGYQIALVNMAFYLLTFYAEENLKKMNDEIDNYRTPEPQMCEIHI